MLQGLAGTGTVAALRMCPFLSPRRTKPQGRPGSVRTHVYVLPPREPPLARPQGRCQLLLSLGTAAPWAWLCPGVGDIRKAGEASFPGVLGGWHPPDAAALALSSVPGPCCAERLWMSLSLHPPCFAGVPATRTGCPGAALACVRPPDLPWVKGFPRNGLSWKRGTKKLFVV